MTREQLTELLADTETRSGLDLLGDREIELFSLLSQGTPWHLIAREMGLEQDEMAKLKAKIQKKLGLRSDVHLLQFAAKHKMRGDD